MTAPPEHSTENGFSFALYPASGGTAGKLVVIMHGHASSPARWQGRAAEMQAKMPEADIIVLQGPVRTRPLPGKPAGNAYTWIPFEKSVALHAQLWLTQAFNHLAVVDDINVFIAAQLQKRGLAEKDFGLIGSSMGGVIGLQAAFHSEKPYGAVVCYAGAVLPFTKVRSRPPLQIGMGAEDRIFNGDLPASPSSRLGRAFARAAGRLGLHHRHTRRRLEKHGVPYAEVIYPGTGHEVTDAVWDDSISFISRNINGKAEPKP